MASRQFDTGGGTTTTSGFGREEFVRTIVDRFETRRLGVDPSVVGYMLSQVVVGEVRWYVGLRTRRINIDLLSRALDGALEQAARRSEAEGRLVVQRRDAEATFPDYIEAAWSCPYGLLLC